MLKARGAEQLICFILKLHTPIYHTIFLQSTGEPADNLYCQASPGNFLSSLG